MLSILLWSVLSFQDNIQVIPSFSPLFDHFFQPLFQHTFLQRILAGLFIFWHCILINRIMVGQRVLSTNSFFPALFYFLIISINPKSIYLSPNLIGLTFILLSFNKILSSYLSSSAKLKIFDSSLLMSIGVLIHPPFIILTPIVWMGMSIFSQTEWRQWVISIIALLFPWLILFTFSKYFLIELLNPVYFFGFLTEMTMPSSLDRGDLLSMCFMGLLSVLAIVELLLSLSRKNIKARKSYILILWTLVLCSLYTLVSPDSFSIKIIIFALPMSAIISNYFYYQKYAKWLNLICIGLIISLFVNHFIW